MILFPNPEPKLEQESPVGVAVEAAAEGGGDPVAAILQALRRGRRFLVLSHARPDGDAIGSMLAFGILLKQMGKQADLVSPDPIPPQYRSLPGAGAIVSAEGLRGPYDAVVLLECGDLERVGLKTKELESLDHCLLINIDHHISGRPYADINWIDHEAASVGEMVYRLAVAAGGTLTPEMASCLYTTVLTDTGGFCYGSVRASTFAWAHDLVKAGAEPVELAQQVCFSTPFAKMQLLGVALGNLQREGSLAWLWVTAEDMARTGAAEEDCEGIVNFALGIVGIEAAVFLRELAQGPIRMSLRSKGMLNVASIAGRLGGGGHQNAAGCTLEGPLQRAINQILNELRRA